MFNLILMDFIPIVYLLFYLLSKVINCYVFNNHNPIQTNTKFSIQYLAFKC